jgi:hypothetical protein
MRRWTISGVLVLVAFLLGSTVPTTTARDLRPPEALTVRWLEPGWVLVRWRQVGDADYVVVYSCADTDRCVAIGALEGAIGGVRTATAWGQPGQYVKIGEFHSTSTPHTYTVYGWSDPIQLPPYETALPVVRGVP